MGLQPQILALTGHMTPVSLSDRSIGSDSTRRRLNHVCVCASVCADIDLDAVVLTTEKLSHPTASRPRVTDRRPRSQVILAVSSFSSVSVPSLSL